MKLFAYLVLAFIRAFAAILGTILLITDVAIKQYSVIPNNDFMLAWVLYAIAFFPSVTMRE